MNEHDYVAAVLAVYVALPDTACRPRRADRALAHQLFAGRVALSDVLDALLLAHTRRHLNPVSPPAPVLRRSRELTLLCSVRLDRAVNSE